MNRGLPHTWNERHNPARNKMQILVHCNSSNPVHECAPDGMQLKYKILHNYLTFIYYVKVQDPCFVATTLFPAYLECIINTLTPNKYPPSGEVLSQDRRSIVLSCPL